MADLAPNGPKLLYDGDYVIVEAFGFYETFYIYDEDMLSFRFRKSPSGYWTLPDTVDFKGDNLKAQNLSFAIDTYFYGRDELKGNLCDQRSSPDLRKLIKRCSNRIVVRELAPKERKQLQVFKSEHRGKELKRYWLKLAIDHTLLDSNPKPA